MNVFGLMQHFRIGVWRLACKTDYVEIVLKFVRECQCVVKLFLILIAHD